MHVKANHYVTVYGAYSVYMHLHLYHRHTHHHALRIKNSLTSTSSIIITIRHNLIIRENKFVHMSVLIVDRSKVLIFSI